LLQPHSEKPLSGLFLARLMGADPTASRVHLFIIFIMAWTISSPCPELDRELGALVSSLYGAPPYGGSHGIRVFANWRI